MSIRRLSNTSVAGSRSSRTEANKTSFTIDALIVGGSGAGGSSSPTYVSGGGGGAGVVLIGTRTVYKGNTYSITIGAGGTATNAQYPTASDGGNTLFDNITALVS